MTNNQSKVSIQADQSLKTIQTSLISLDSKNLNGRKRAFSMIELSIVLLIISILAAMVNQGSAVIKKSRLAEARRLTNSSIVPKINDLGLWYESTMPGAVLDSTKNNITNDGSPVSFWSDRSNQLNFNNNATASGSPQYVSSSINSLPALRFIANDSDKFTFDGTFLDNQYYTIFLVAKRTAAATTTAYLLGGSSSGLKISYNSDTSLSLQNEAATALTATINQYSDGENGQILVFVTSPSGKTIYVNGTIKSSDSIPTLFTSWTNSATIGSDNNLNYFNGEITEIIIYRRALNDQERRDVLDYLAKKFAIKTS